MGVYSRICMFGKLWFYLKIVVREFYYCILIVYGCFWIMLIFKDKNRYFVCENGREIRLEMWVFFNIF